VSTHDVKLEALHEINRARAYIGNVHLRLLATQKKLKRAGIQVETLDLTLADTASANEHTRAARLALWTAFIDERKAKCA